MTTVRGAEDIDRVPLNVFGVEKDNCPNLIDQDPSVVDAKKLDG